MVYIYYVCIFMWILYICIYVVYMHMGVDLNSFFSTRPFLAKKQFTLAKLSHIQRKLSRAPMLDYMWEFLVGNKSLTRDIWASERPSKLILRRLHIHMWCFAFHGGPAHLLRPVLTLPPWKQGITSQQFRPPGFQEKAVFRQALSKLSPNFRENRPT